MEKWITPVNLLLALTVIAVLAKISADLTAYRLADGLSISSPHPRSSVSDAKSAQIDFNSLSPILREGLLGEATKGELAPIAMAGAKGRPSSSPAELILLGTVMGSFRETFALIQRPGSKEERVFRLGDKVFDSGELVSVKKDSVEVLSGGRRLKIFIPTAVAGSASGPSPTQGGGVVPHFQGAPSNQVIDQRALNAALDNIGQTMTDARLLPSSKDGRVEGFRVSEVRPSGVFAMVGVRNGDLLMKVNDFPIDSPEKAIQSFVSLKGQNRIKLDLVRDGQPTSLNYDIR